MDLYVIRHADAARLGENGIQDDASRPLTDAGWAQARQVAAGLKKRDVKLDLVLTSPLVRARQTAEEMLRHWGQPVPELRVCEELLPETRAKKLARYLRDQPVTALAIVGHQPYLGGYIAWLIGSRKAQVEIAKAGVAYIAFPEEINKGEGTLEWLVTREWLA